MPSQTFVVLLLHTPASPQQEVPRAQLASSPLHNTSSTYLREFVEQIVLHRGVLHLQLASHGLRSGDDGRPLQQGQVFLRPEVRRVNLDQQQQHKKENTRPLDGSQMTAGAGGSFGSAVVDSHRSIRDGGVEREGAEQSFYRFRCLTLPSVCVHQNGSGHNALRRANAMKPQGLLSHMSIRSQTQ